jgi:hypothetical protein
MRSVDVRNEMSTTGITNNVRARRGCIAVRYGMLRLARCLRVRLLAIDDVRDPFIAPAAIDGRERHRCSREHAR